MERLLHRKVTHLRHQWNSGTAPLNPQRKNCRNFAGFSPVLPIGRPSMAIIFEVPQTSHFRSFLIRHVGKAARFFSGRAYLIERSTGDVSIAVVLFEPPLLRRGRRTFFSFLRSPRPSFLLKVGRGDIQKFISLPNLPHSPVPPG